MAEKIKEFRKKLSDLDKPVFDNLTETQKTDIIENHYDADFINLIYNSMIEN